MARPGKGTRKTGGGDWKAEEGRGAHIVFEVLIMHGLAGYHQRRGGCLVNDSCLTEWSGDHISLSLYMMDRA